MTAWSQEIGRAATDFDWRPFDFEKSASKAWIGGRTPSFVVNDGFSRESLASAAAPSIAGVVEWWVS